MEKNISKAKTSTSASSNVAILLSHRNKLLVTIGCCTLTFFMTASRGALSVVQSLLLEDMGAMQHFPLFVVAGSFGLTLMTPIGSKLGDIFGRKSIIIIACLLCSICLLGLSVVRYFPVFLLLQLGLGIGLGIYTATPYILIRLINEPKDVPKGMGLLSTAMAVGGLCGSFFSGFLSKLNYISWALRLPIICPLLVIICFCIALPETKNITRPKLDFPGIAILTILTGSLVLSLTYGGRIGWTNPIILFGFLLTAIMLILFIKIENHMEKGGITPIISMRLFRNKEYTIILIIGVACVFYQSAMSNYGALTAIQVLHAPMELTGSLLLPRTIATILLPAFVGGWVGKKTGRLWKSMAIASGLVVVAHLPLMMISTSMSVIILLIAYGITGISESFKAVSVTPSAQECLERKDISTGTAIINFSNTLGGLMAAAFSGALYNAFNEGGTNIAAGVRPVFALAAGVALAAFLLVIIFVRKFSKKENAAMS